MTLDHRDPLVAFYRVRNLTFKKYPPDWYSAATVFGDIHVVRCWNQDAPDGWKWSIQLKDGVSRSGGARTAKEAKDLAWSWYVSALMIALTNKAARFPERKATT